MQGQKKQVFGSLMVFVYVYIKFISCWGCCGWRMERGEACAVPDGFPVSLEACIQAEQSIKFVQAVSG